MFVNPAPEPEKNASGANMIFPPVINKLPVIVVSPMKVVVPVNTAGPKFLNVLLPLTVNEPVIVTLLLKCEPDNLD